MDERSKENTENMTLDLTSITVEELDISLADFYANVRIREGDIHIFIRMYSYFDNYQCQVTYKIYHGPFPRELFSDDVVW